MTIVTKMTSVFKGKYPFFTISHVNACVGVYTRKEVQLSVGARLGYLILRAKVRGVWDLGRKSKLQFLYITNTHF